MSLRIMGRLGVALLAVGLPLVGCGGSNPASPSAGGGVVLHGVVLGSGASSSSSATPEVSAQSTSGRITVTIQEQPSFSATVSANGTFELEGLPAGTLTLVFSSNGVVIGTVTITGVPSSAEVKVVVQVETGTVILVTLEVDDKEGDSSGDSNKTCMIEGGKALSGIELEGSVSSGTALAFKLSVNGNRASGLVDVNASGAQFKCNGNPNSSGNCQDSVKAGAQVHVRGTLTTCSTTAATVVATQVMVQKAGN
jgi:hypothetical protein